MNFLSLFLLSMVSPAMLWASGASHEDPVAPILYGLVILFSGAKLGGYLATKLSQPAVLGELIMGVLIGNMGLLGYSGFHFILETEIFSILASLGVILLLFEVGLESSIGELLKVGVTSLIVAVIGVIFPFILGYIASVWYMPAESVYVHAFVGATLCATSVGITARVFKDLNKINIKEAKIILGAAVIDDVLGLIILAIVSGVIINVAKTGTSHIEVGSILFITFKALGFLLGALVIGSRVAPHLFKFGAKLKMEGMLLTLSLLFCFVLAYLANLVGLAPIVGAFAAGLIIDGTGYSKFFDDDHDELENLIFPLSKFFVPIFFVYMGMQVDLTTFSDMGIILFGLILSGAAILGKQVCGLGVFGLKNSGVNRILIGIGMIPRGEVGLIFAAIGANLQLNGHPVVNNSLYSAIVLMVLITTMITPPGLKWSLKPSA